MSLSYLLLLGYGAQLAIAQSSAAGNLSTSSVTTLSLTLTVETEVPTSTGLSNGLALTPPMGFSSWNMFGPDISEQLFKDTIDAMAMNGLRDAGYIYVNLDDGWQRYPGNRSQSPLEPDPVKFPNGMKALADYAHEKGFKLGIYSGPGDMTCAGFTGSLGHEEEDANMFASWGIDHLKYDSCCSAGKDIPVPEIQEIFLKMSQALIDTSRSIVFHACQCGWSNIWEWAASEGANQWRIGQDISDDFNYPGNREKYYFDVLDMLDVGNNLTQYSGPGHWNDYDMLIVGLDGNSTQLVGTGASNIEYRTHFSMWCMVASPLLIGADVRKLSAYDLETLTNPEVISISQDPLGQAASVVATQDPEGNLQVYAKEMADGSYAVALLNRGPVTAEMSISARRDLTMTWDRYRLRDLWKHQDHGCYDIPYTVEVMPHEAKVLRMWQVMPNATACMYLPPDNFKG